TAIALRHSLAVVRVKRSEIVSPFFASIEEGSKPLSVTFTSTMRPAAVSAGGAGRPDRAGGAGASAGLPQPVATERSKNAGARKRTAAFTAPSMTSGPRGVKRRASRPRSGPRGDPRRASRRALGVCGAAGRAPLRGGARLAEGFVALLAGG